MVLYICFVDPHSQPFITLKEDSRCQVTDDGNVMLTEGQDTMRFGTLNSFYAWPDRNEWTFCTDDKRLAEAVRNSLEAGTFCGLEPDSKKTGQISKAFEIGRCVGREGRTVSRR